MTFLNSWEDFEMAAERLYLQDPMKVRQYNVNEQNQTICQFLTGSSQIATPTISYLTYLIYTGSLYNEIQSLERRIGNENDR